MIKRKHILKETPQDDYCKEILKKAAKAEIKLRMRDWQLEDDWWRKRIKSNLLDAKPILNECFSIYRKMVMQGHNDTIESHEDKLEKIKKGFTAVRKATTKFEVGGAGPTKGILNKTTFPMVVKRYRNLMKVILEDLIVGTIKDAGKKSENEEEFYSALFEKTYQWAGSLVFRIWAKEGEEAEGLEEEEEIEGEEVEEGEFAEVVGEIA